MTADEVGAFVDAAAALLRLPIAPDHRPGVIRYFSLAADMAGLLDTWPLATTDDPAAVFVPIAPNRAAP